ncbi:DUF3158 family protein [Phocoenobacter skyensis]|uniref:DUF3158 family protein n=1 Tax=Phocoenobacter skyensis TaxID=97481 RepID=UPI0027795285|nr:DUF3158 family protein [Pasteurella skyensis]MDP8185285.1 DUF3158 family protein [Pasteurella skyensis]
MSLIIPDNLYKELARDTHLNDIQKQLFSFVTSIDEYEYLQSELIDIRNVFFQKMKEMVSNYEKSELNGLGLCLKISHPTSGEGRFLRWVRTDSYEKQKKGTKETVIIRFLRESDIPSNHPIRLKIVKLDEERILINTQMRILCAMIKNLNISIKNVNEVEQFLEKKE